MVPWVRAGRAQLPPDFDPPPPPQRQVPSLLRLTRFKKGLISSAGEFSSTDRKIRLRGGSRSWVSLPLPPLPRSSGAGWAERTQGAMGFRREVVLRRIRSPVGLDEILEC